METTLSLRFSAVWNVDIVYSDQIIWPCKLFAWLISLCGSRRTRKPRPSCHIRNSWERNIQGFPHVFIPKLQFTTSCISAHIHITVFQLVSLQSVCSPLLNTITTYLVSFTFICQRAECTTCLLVKSTILSTASQPSYGYKYDDRQVTAYTTL